MEKVIAQQLLDYMTSTESDNCLYRGQIVTRAYVRRVLWRCYSYEDHRRAMKSAAVVQSMHGYRSLK
jgi:hypothetical protein